jgi:hypothetical protein
MSGMAGDLEATPEASLAKALAGEGYLRVSFAQLASLPPVQVPAAKLALE